MLMGQAKKDPSKAAEAEEIKKQVTAQADRLKELETKEAELQDKIRDIMYTIPQMIDPQCAHRPGRQLQCGSTALWRSCCAGLSHPVPC